MNTRENIEAALAQARADCERASAERAKAGTDWRKQNDPTVTYDKVRSNWGQADAAWNKANAEVTKLATALAELDHVEGAARKRAALEAAVARARVDREKADAALAAVAKARAEREKIKAAAVARAERRGSENDRRKPGHDRRKSAADRRNTASGAGRADSATREWTDAVNSYNKADADWNKARAALADFIRTGW